MKFIRYFCLFLIFPICLLFTSCRLFNNNEHVNTADDSEKYGKNVLNQILNALENNDRDKLIDLFSDKAKTTVTEDSIDALFNFYKGTQYSVDYNYSVEVDIFEASEQYIFDECLAYVKTNEAAYWFEFLLCKNNNSEGIVSLVVSTEKSRESSEYSDYIIRVFDEAEYLNKDYFGVFIFCKE
ncbi:MULTISPECIES: DUF5104 domain-containing protein [unclassified Ruminococcus]|uniref:DUF5104 domain-containing protein n=1 Tax=unclassified Ruminococcus TaxID=2608920 RepID=UPI00210F1974|nr:MULTISPECIES: DUF5104 domain-containing protein [unclassified Ruminococcus]MCQ4023225.1 DUF5104 domain-containing protein [Ruminococcus sp. zg-924]MCQ4115606.1 DUF5104 domain-containing protein [Ruminococcus sp. zg-921]